MVQEEVMGKIEEDNYNYRKQLRNVTAKEN
jgi:hypothetical protein